MTKRLRRMSASVLMLLILFGAMLTASALDDTYRFDDLGMSVKISKNYYVITRETPQDDPVFETLKLSYSETLRTFEEADIYLRAFDPEGTLRISMTVRSDENSRSVNNYSELSDAQRKGILDALLGETGVTSAVEVKRGNYIFFDTSRETQLDSEPLYVNQCNTIVNGLQIDLSLQKSAELIRADEAKVLTAIASSMEFDTVKTASSGPVFDWWRLLLWVGILAGLTAALSAIYKHQNNVRRRQLEERRRKRAEAQAAGDTIADVITADDQPVTFEETLGYRDADRFSSRAGTDLDTYDISVRDKDPSHGVSYFEDGGKSIDDRSEDYFDTYFKDPTPTRSGIARMFSTVGAYIGIFFRHIGYFFKNLFGVTRRKKKD